MLQLPPDDQLGTGATAPAPAATTAPAAAAATPTATPEAEEEPEAEETPAATTPVTSTTSVTSTTEISETDDMTDTVESDAGDDAAEPTVDLVTQLKAQGGFTILVDALEAAGLSDALEGAGPFTVFRTHRRRL